MKITKNNIEDVFNCKEKSLTLLESQGYEFIENLFCDNSGFGQDNEPAYTPNQTVEQVKRLVSEYGTIYAFITSVGQFQVNVGIFSKTGKKTSKKLENNTYLLDNNKVLLHDTIVLEQKGDNVILNSGGYQTKTTKNRLNKYMPVGYNLSQSDFQWYIHDIANESITPFQDGMKLEGKLNI